MPAPPSRRTLLIGLAAVAPTYALADGPVGDEVAALERTLGGRIGVHAQILDRRPLVAHRSDERFAMASSFKWLLAAAVLERVDQGRERLDRLIAYDGSALLGHSPITQARVAEGALSVETLAMAVVTQSDNGAANLLLASIGGPPALTAFLRRHGDPTTRLDRIEMALNTAIPGDPRDTTTPRAMAGDLARLLFKPGLSNASRVRLQDWMIANRTGDARLRAGLPKNLVIGDKTGTGERGAIGDVGFVTYQVGPPLLLAVYVQAPEATPDAREAAIARCAAIVWQSVSQSG